MYFLFDFGHTKPNMNHLEKEVAPLSTFESKLIKENQNLLKKLDQQTQRITEQDQQIKQLTEQVEFLTKTC